MTIAKAPLAIDGVLTPSAQIRKGMMAAIGSGGVSKINDFRVSASAPAAQSLVVGSGLAVVPNGYQTSPDEVYVVSNPSGHLVTSGEMPGSSGSTTYWLVALVVGDPTFSASGHPFMPSSFDSAQLNTFQFNRIVILPCTSTTTSFSQLGKNYPGLALARLAIPPVTTTITDAMITDLRVRSGQGRLISRMVASNVGGFLTAVPNNTNGYILWTRDITIASGELPVAAARAFVKVVNTGNAGGNQQIGQYLQYRFDDTGTWTDLDYGSSHNAGDATSNMGAALMGNLDIPAGTTKLSVRVSVNVAAGGFSWHSKINDLTLNFFS